MIDTSIVLKDNAMLNYRPELFEEWDFEKNDELGLDIYKVTKGSSKKVWWIGRCGHKWDSMVSNRVKGSNCPYCAGIKFKVGYNDMWTTNPELASLLANPEDGYKCTQLSTKKVDWKCSNCQVIIKNKTINYYSTRLPYCSICSDGTSYPEKIISNLLLSLEIEFETEKVFKWSNNKRYDFYIPSLECIIEVHGRQHYFESRGNFKSKNLKEEQENDYFKERIAIANDIKNYIIIDAKNSSFNYIKNNIINSSLGSIIDIKKVVWMNIEKSSRKSHYIEILNLWKKGLSVSDIFKQTKHSRNTIRRALNSFADAGLCDYGIDKKIIQKNKNNEIIREWQSVKDIVKNIGLSKNCILRVCKGERPHYKGFIWEYKKK